MAVEILTEQVPRGIKGSKPSPNHHGQACRREEASCQWGKLGLSGTQGLGGGGSGGRGWGQERILNRDHLSWSCKYVNNYVRGTGHFRASRWAGKGERRKKRAMWGSRCRQVLYRGEGSTLSRESSRHGPRRRQGFFPPSAMEWGGGDLRAGGPSVSDLNSLPREN